MVGISHIVIFMKKIKMMNGKFHILCIIGISSINYNQFLLVETPNLELSPDSSFAIPELTFHE